MSVIGSTAAQPAPGRGSLLPVPAACAAALAVVVYLNALDNPYVYDDFRLIVENPSILHPLDLRALVVRDVTRPMGNLSYAVDTMLWGRVPFGYHVTNLLLHVLNVVLVFWVALLAVEDRTRQSGQRIGARASPTVTGFAAAALFAVHPMMTQAVGYISGRFEVLYSASFLLAFLAGRRWLLGGGKRWWATCVGLWVVAMLTKETAAMLSFVLIAYDWFVLDTDWTTRQRRFLRLGLPLLAITLIAGAGRVAVLQFVEYSDAVRRDWRFALAAIDAFWRYLAMFVVPHNQSIFHAPTAVGGPTSALAIAEMIGLAGVVPLMWQLRRVHSLMAFGFAWFALLLVPSIALFILGRGEAMVEHRAYLPAAGLFLFIGCAFGALWARPGRQRMLVAVTAVVFLAQLGFQAVIRNAIWQDPVMLSREAANLAPNHWMPRILLGEALRQNGRCAEAVPEYRAAIAIRPQDEFPYARLAGCLIEGRRLEEAEATLRQLRTVNPASLDASMGLGVFAILNGRLDDSRAHFQDVLTHDPGRERAKQLLAFVEGTLPADENRRLCAEFETVTDGVLTIDQCPTADAQRGNSDPPVASHN